MLAKVEVTVLCLTALAFAAFGVQWLVDPIAMAKALGIILTNGDATSDARAVYGGMELGLGAFQIFCAVSPARRPVGLTAAAMVLSGLGLARFTGILLADGGVSGATYQLLATDAVGAVLCAAAVWSRSVRKKMVEGSGHHGVGSFT